MLRHKSSIEQECLQVSREAVSGRLTFHARGAATHRRMSDLQVMDAGVVVVLSRSLTPPIDLSRARLCAER